MKYKIGDKVKAKGQSDVHEVLGFNVDKQGIVYKVSSKEVDVQLKELVIGVSFYKEEELEAIK